jgi:PIN domain nuclease of toxin-antitoxin system
MGLLLDTHVFLWYVGGASQLPAVFREAIRSPGNRVYLSVASIWEAVIKHSLGKLSLPGPPAHYLPRQRELHRIESLSVDEGALLHLAALPSLHRDPFDRILLAQALEYNLVVVAVDAAVLAYPAMFLPAA